MKFSCDPKGSATALPFGSQLNYFFASGMWIGP
jgi:hypothetical protein